MGEARLKGATRLGGTVRDSNRQLSIDLCAQCHFIWGLTGGPLLLTKGSSTPTPSGYTLDMHHYTYHDQYTESNGQFLAVLGPEHMRKGHSRYLYISGLLMCAKDDIKQQYFLFMHIHVLIWIRYFE